MFSLKALMTVIFMMAVMTAMFHYSCGVYISLEDRMRCRDVHDVRSLDDCHDGLEDYSMIYVDNNS
jgi:hypothetical protein